MKLLLSLLFFITVAYNLSAQQGFIKNPYDTVSSPNNKRIHKAGARLRSYAKQVAVGYLFNAAGAAMLVSGVRNESEGLIVVGTALSFLGTLITVIAPHQVGLAGRELEKVRDE